MKLGFPSERSLVECQQKISISQAGVRGFLVQMSQGLSIVTKVKGRISIAAGVKELLPQCHGPGDVVAHTEGDYDNQEKVESDCGLALHGKASAPGSNLVLVVRFYARAQS